MNERNTQVEREAQVVRWRKRQVMAVACSVACFTTALVGAAFRVAVVAQVGVAAFLGCLVAIIVFGVVAGRYGRGLD